MNATTQIVLPGLKIRGFSIPTCIVQGGMGVRVSGPDLTRAVYNAGGFGVLSSAGLKGVFSLKNKRPYTTYEAVREEVETAMAGGFLTGINVMCKLARDYDETIRAAVDAKVSALFLGAGLPKKIENLGDTAVVWIVSSARALKILLRWWRPRLPDAVVVEGPEAGGHLGFDPEEIGNPNFSLENIIPDILKLAKENGNFPVIVAGGIWDKNDIVNFLNRGVSGVQIATRFAVTTESGATEGYKNAVVNSTKEDIKVVMASPCGYPFRILTTSPMFNVLRKPKCDLGLVLDKDESGNYTVCKAHPNSLCNNDYFCICNGLTSAVGLKPNEPALYTVGSNAYRVQSVVSVADLMGELTRG
jgi:nitronate monooxygenase